MRRRRALVVLGALLALRPLRPLPAGAQCFHGCAIGTDCTGLAGETTVCAGAALRCVVQVVNLDTCGDDMNVIGATITIHHADGDASSGVLVPPPGAELPFYGDSATFAFTGDVVRPADIGTELVATATADAVDLLTGQPCGGGFPAAVTVVDCGGPGVSPATVRAVLGAICSRVRERKRHGVVELQYGACWVSP